MSRTTFGAGVAAIVIGGLLAMSPKVGVAKESAPKGVVVFRDHALTDPGLNDMVAGKLLVPQGWKLEGGIERTQMAHNPLLSHYTVVAPDGREVEFGPSLNFFFRTAQPGPFMSKTAAGYFYSPLPSTVGVWLTQMSKVDAEISGFQVVSEEIVKSITDKLRTLYAPRYREIAQRNQVDAQIGVRTDFNVQMHKLVLRYTDAGRAMESTLFVQSSYFVGYRNEKVEHGMWTLSNYRAVSGPVGSSYRNDPVLMAVFRSLRTNPDWSIQIQMHWRRLADAHWRASTERLAALREQAKQNAKQADDISDKMMKGWRKRNSMTDAGGAKLVDAIHERTPYVTPAGESITLPSYYDHVYTDGQGMFLLHNNPNLDPRTDRAFQDRTWQPVPRAK